MSPEWEAMRGLPVQGRLVEKRNKLLGDFLREHHLDDPKSIQYSPLVGVFNRGVSRMLRRRFGVPVDVWRLDGFFGSLLMFPFTPSLMPSGLCRLESVWTLHLGRFRQIGVFCFCQTRRLL